MNDKAKDTIDTMVDTLLSMWDRYNEPVAEATLSLIRFEHLFFICLGFLVSAGFFCLYWKLLTKTRTLRGCEQGEQLFSISIWCLPIVLVPAFTSWLNFKYWLAVYDPKLYLLRQVVGKVLYD